MQSLNLILKQLCKTSIRAFWQVMPTTLLLQGLTLWLPLCTPDDKVSGSRTSEVKWVSHYLVYFFVGRLMADNCSCSRLALREFKSERPWLAKKWRRRTRACEQEFERKSLLFLSLPPPPPQKNQRWAKTRFFYNPLLFYLIKCSALTKWS